MKKILLLVLLLAMMLGCFTGCGKTPVVQIPEVTIGDQNATKSPMPTEESGGLRWPKFGVCNFLPVPPSNEGKINEDSSDEADIDVYAISQNDFYQYVVECQEMGFVLDYYSDDSEYEAYNEEGYYLWIDYDKETKVMNIWIYYDEDYGEENTEDITEEVTEAATEEITETPTKETAPAKGLRPDFKEAMDSYEAFMDEYVEFMKKYKKNPSDWSLLADYAKFMADYAKFAEDFEKWNSEDMNDAELAYYLEVQARVTKKLTEIA